MFKTDYIDYSNLKNIGIIEDNRMLNLFNEKKNVELQEVDISKFKHCEIEKYDNYYDLSKQYIFYSAYTKEERNVYYGISKYYYEDFIPKLLKNNPGIKIMESIVPKKHTFREIKFYYFVDNGEIIGILAPNEAQVNSICKVL